ncbi:phage terminase large subunit family protein [Clostridium weizhouense]|uniref:Terminase large subunit gp17-like C-terminal domain-containing protein n=1 Tax=Clostridium weizhouense TaxID=2859781 RepID=A0ABS7AQR1_9CLOT|nr:hypothetical protein [Clostridium weizhouense]MBW6410969.1 hypothetical protein [Clostridium weizhouense]
MNNAEKLKKVWNNPVLWIQNFLKITDKNGKVVPFILNPMQKDFIKNLDSYNIILKARQGGMSVAICGLAIYYAVTQPNSTCMMLSHNDESTRAIFNKLKNIYNSLPSTIKLKLIRNNRAELQLSNGSIISCSTMGHTDKSRGNTLKLCHISEFAFVKSDIAEKQLLAIEQAIQANGNLIIESTANGLNHYNILYNKAKKQENAYKGFFYNYIDTSCMFLDEYKKYKKIFKNINGHDFGTEDLTGEEKDLLKIEGMTLDILCWRRMKIQNSSVEAFNQEFPLTDSMAFITSGHSVFNNERITNVLRVLQLNKDKYLKKSEINDLPVCKKYYGKSFFMYKKPKEGEKYYIGVDCSEGVGKDYSCFVVLNRDGEEVAMFKDNKIKAYAFAECINEIGRYYNKAYVTIETASAGNTVIERLKHTYKYVNMAKYKAFDEFNRVKWRVGFDTNSKTKGLIINDLVECFDKGQICINSIDILEEMKVFEIKDNNSMGAMNGYHDDGVMSLALALSGVKSRIYYKWR